jgi:hypothetical protein
LRQEKGRKEKEIELHRITKKDSYTIINRSESKNRASWRRERQKGERNRAR